MFNMVLTYLETGVTRAFTFLGDLLSGGIGVIFDSTASELTQFGELILLSALIGLGMWGLNFVISMIPFTRMGKK